MHPFITQAVQAFDSYLDGFNRDDDKIRLKIVHTYGVVDMTREVCRRMGVPEIETNLAVLIALLHDIGRFEQVRRFDSFEPTTMDHASFGVELLFGESNMIREFTEDDTWDDIIEYAIAKHSDYMVPKSGHPEWDFFAWLLRDADKLDNCRVKLEEPIETMLGCSAEEVGKHSISPAVMEECLQGMPVTSSKRRTKMDYWVSYIAYFFDISYAESAKLILENHYVDRIIRRIPYSNRKTEQQMWELYDRVIKALQEMIDA